MALVTTILLLLLNPKNASATPGWNDVADGAWNDGATWGHASPGVEGVDYPGPGAYPTIDSHTVTVTADQTIYGVYVDGGTLNLGTSELTITGELYYVSGTLNAGTSRVIFTEGAYISGSHTLNDVIFDPNVAFDTTMTIAVGTTLTVAGDLTIDSSDVGKLSIVDGTIAVQGDITIDGPDLLSSTSSYNTATLLINGSGNQAFTVQNSTRTSGGLPNVTIAKGGGTLTLDGTIRTARDWTYTSGTIDPGTSTVVFTTASAQMRNITGSHNLNNVIFDTNSATASTFTIGAATTLTVEGDLTIDNTNSGQMNLLTGTLAAQGHVSIDGLNIYTTLSGSTTTLLFNGTGAQNFDVQNSTRTTGGMLPVNINKPSGTLSLSGIIRTIRDWTWVAGTVAPGTSTVVFATYGSEARTITGSHTLNNIIFDSNSTSVITYTIAAGTVISAGGDLTIENSSTAAMNFMTGTIGAAGNIVVDGLDIYFATSVSTATIQPNGGGNHSLTVNNCTRTTGGFLNLDVNKSGGTLSLIGTIRTFRNWTVTSGTIDPGSSTVVFATRSAEPRSITGSHSLNDVIFDSNSASGMAFTIGAATTVTIEGDLTVDNSSSALMDINSGTLAVKGDIYFDGANLQVATGVNTALLLINGNTDQTLTVANSTRTSGAFVNLNIDKSGGTLFLVGTIRTAKNWTYTSGTIDPGSATVVFSTRTTETRTLTGSHSLNDVIFDNNNASAMTYTIATGTTLTVEGDLTLDTTGAGTTIFDIGTIAAKGDILVDGPNISTGTATLLINGTGDQTLTMQNASRTSGNLLHLNVDKPSGTLFLSGTIRTNRDWTLTNGTIDAAASTVVFATPSGTGQTRNITGSHSLNNVIFDVNTNTASIYSFVGGTVLTVEGTLTIDNTATGVMTFNDGTIAAEGDIIVDGPTVGSSGTAILLVNGTVDQTLTMQNATRTSGFFLHLNINKPSGTLFLAGTIRTTRDWTYTAGTIDAAASTVVFATPSATGQTRNITGSHSLSNVIFDVSTNTASIYSLVGGTVLTVEGTLTIDNTFTGGMTFNDGTIAAEGDIVVDGTTVGSSGTAILLVNGTADQTFTMQNATRTSGFLLHLNINKPSGTLFLAGTIRTTRDWTYTAGTIDAAASTVVFATPSATGQTRNISGTHSLNNVIFDVNTNTSSIFSLVGGTVLTALGDLTLANSFAGIMTINSGELIARGNLVTNATVSTAGTAAITLSGGNAQTVNAVNIPRGTFTVNKTGGTAATLLANLVANGAGQDLTITSGILDLAGFNLTVADVFTNNDTLRLRGSETLTFSGGGGFDEDSGTVDFNGTGTYAAGLPNGFGDQFYNLTFSGVGGAWTLDANTTVAADFTATAGTLDINDRTFAISGNTTINGGTVLTGTNTVTFGNAGGDTVAISSGELRIESDIPNTDIVTNAGSWTNSGGTISYAAGSAITQNLLTGQTTYYNLSVNSDATTYTLPDANVTVAGRLTLTDGTLAFDNDKNLIVNDTAATGTAIAVVSGATLSNTGTGNLTIGGGVSNAGAITFNSSDDAGNGITIASSDGTTVRDWSGSGTFSMTDVSASFQSADISDPEFIFANSSTDDGDNTNWAFPPGTLTAPTVTLANLGTGRTGNATIAFTLENVLPSDGKIVVVFPAGFDLTSVNAASSAADLDGSLAVSVVGQTVTITRSGGTAKAEGATVDDLVLANVKNPVAEGATGTYDISTTTAADVIFDAGTAAASNLVLSVDYVWDGGGNATSWSDPLNWTANSGYPDDAWDTATISSTAHAITTPGALTIGELTLGGTYSGTLNLAGALTLDNSEINSGSFTQSSGTLDVTAIAYQINVDGNWTRSGGVFNSRTGTVVFTRASGTQLLNSGGTGASNDFTNLTHSAGGTLQLTGNTLDLLGNFTNSAGTFDANSININVRGAWNSTGGDFISGTNTVSFSNGAQTIVTGGVDDNHDFHHVSISLLASSQDLSINTDVMDVDGDLTFTQGEFVAGTISLAGNLIVGAGVGSNGGTGTISFDGTGLQTVTNSSESTSRVANIQIASASQVRLDNSVAIGSLTVDNGGALDATGKDILVSGNWTVDAGASFVTGGNTVSFVNNHVTVISGGVDDSHDFDDVVFNPIDSSRDFTVSTFPMDIDGDFTFSRGELVAGTINLAGNLVVGSGLGGSGGLATINFDGTLLQTVSNATGSTSPIASFTISNTDEVRLDDSVVIGGLTVSNAGELNANSKNLSVRGNWTVDPGGIFTSGANTVTFYGDNITIITGGTDNNHDFDNVVVALTNSTRDWIISTNDMDIAGDLTLTSGQTSIATNVYLAGDLSVTSTNVGVALGAGPLVFSGSGVQAVSNAAGEAEALARIVVANTADAVQLLNTITVAALTIDAAAVLDLNGNNITASGVFANNGTLSLRGSEAPTFSGAGGFDEDSGTVEFNGTGTYASGLPNVFADRFYNLTFNGSGGTWRLDANLRTENITLTNGRLDVNDYVLTIDGDTVINGATLQTGVNAIHFGDDFGDDFTMSAGRLEIESDVPGSDISRGVPTATLSGGTIAYTATTPVNAVLEDNTFTSYYNLEINSSGSTYTTYSMLITTVKGRLTVVDGTFAFDNITNVVVRDDDATGTAIVVAADGSITNSGGGDLTIGGNVVNDGAITFNSNNDAGNGIAIASQGGAIVRSWSGTGTFTMTDVAVSNQSANISDPEYILTSSSTNSGGNTNWIFPLGDLTAADVTPASLVTSATGDVTVVLTNENVIPSDGKIVVVFPAGFDVSAVSGATSAADIDGSLAVGVAGQTVTITRSAGTAIAEGSVINDLVIAGVKNPVYDGLTGDFTVSTSDSANTQFDTVTVSGVTITGGTDYVWTGSGDGVSWEDEDNWDVGFGYPSNNEDTAIVNSTADAITTAGAITIGAYTQGGTFSGSVTLGGALSLDDAGGKSGDFSVSSGTFDTSSGNNYALNVDRDFTLVTGVFQARNSTITVHRNVSIADVNGLFVRGNSTILLAGSGTLSAPHFNGLWNVVQQNGVTTTISGGVFMNGGGNTFTSGDATSTIQDDGNNSVVQLNYGSLVNNGATWLSTAPGRLILRLRGSAVGGGDYGNSDFRFDTATGADSTLTGHVVTTGDCQFGWDATPNTTATFSTNGYNFSVANMAVGTTTGNWNGHLIAGASTITISGNLTIRDAAAGRNNIFDAGSGQVFVGGSLIVENVDAVPGTLTAGTSTFTFNAAVGTPTITSAGNAFNDVIFNDAGNNITLTLEDAFDVNGDLTITGGSLDTKAAENNSIAIGGDFVNDDILITNTSTVTFDGTAAQTIDAGGSGIGNNDPTNDFNNVVISNTAATVSLVSELEVDGTLTINNSATLDVDSQAFDLNGTLVNNGTLILQGGEALEIGVMDSDSGTVLYDGTASATISAIVSYFNLTFDESGTSDPTYTLPDSNVTVNGVLNVTDGVLVYDNDKNLVVNDNGNTTTALTIAAAGSLSNTGTGDLTIGGNVANAGSISFNSSNDAGNAIVIATEDGSTARTWTGVGTFSFVDVAVSYQITANPDPDYIIASSSTDSGDNTNWVFPVGTLTSVSVTPASLATSASGNVTVEFTNQYLIPSDGKIVIVFPAGFDVSGISAATSVADIDGTLAVGVSGQTVTLTRSGGSSIAEGLAIDDLILVGVVNPAYDGLTSTFTVSTTDAANTTFDTASASGVTIAGGTGYVWTGNGDGNSWEDEDNWNIGVGYPSSNTDTATINTTADAITTAGAITVGVYTQGGTFTGSVTLGGTFTVDDAAGAAGNFSLSSGTFDTANAGNYAVAIDGGWTISGGTFQARASTITTGGNISFAAGSTVFLSGTSTVILTRSSSVSNPLFANNFHNLTQNNGVTTTLTDTVRIEDGTFTTGDATSTIQDDNSGIKRVLTLSVVAVVHNGATFISHNSLEVQIVANSFTGGNYGNVDIRFYGNLTTLLTGDLSCGDIFLLPGNANYLQILDTGGFDVDAASIDIGHATIGNRNGRVVANDSTITISGDVIIRDADVGRLNSIVGNTANINVGGSWSAETVSAVAGSFTPGSSTVTFNATAAAPTIASGGSAFHNVVFDDANNNITFTLEDAFDANGSLTISGATLDTKNGENNSIAVGGNFTNDDIFISRSSTVTFDGTAAQSIDAGGTGIANDDANNDFHNVVISNSSSAVTQLSELEVDGTLTINNSAVLDVDGFVFDLNGTLVNNGTLVFRGAESRQIGVMDTDSGTVRYDGTASVTLPADIATYFNLTFDESGSGDPTYTLPDSNLVVNGVLSVADAALAFDDDKNLTVNDNGVTGTAIAVAAASSILNSGSGDLILGGDVENAGTVTFNSSDDAGNGIEVSSNGAAREWSGAGTFAMTDVTVSDQSVDVADPEYIVAVSSTDDGGNSNWIFSGGAMSDGAVDLSLPSASSNNNATVSFTTQNLVPADGKIVVVFPAGFDLSGVAAATSAADIDGALAVAVVGQSVVITRSGGTAIAAATVVDDLVISNVINPATAGLTATFGLSSRTSDDTVLDSATVAGVVIAATQFNVSVAVTFDGDPLAGVTLTSAGLGNAVTNGGGAHDYGAVASDSSYTITPSKVGYVFTPSNVTVAALANDETHVFTATALYTIAGVVSEGGAPLSGVAIDGGVLGSTSTNGSGQYSFSSVVNATSYTITPSKSGYSFSPESISATINGADAAHNFTAIAEDEAGTSISGRVLAANIERSPIPGVTVSNGSQSDVTDELGNFSLENVEEGEYSLTAVKDNFKFELVTDSQSLSVSDVDIDNLIFEARRAPGKTIYAMWNGFFNSSNIAEIVNYSTTRPLVVTLHILSNVASASGPAAQSSSITIAPGRQQDVVINMLDGFSTDSYGIVKLSMSHADFDGRLSVYSPKAFTSEQEFGYAVAFASPSAGVKSFTFNTFYPGIAVSSVKEVHQWLSIANTNSARAATFTVEKRSFSGELLSEEMVTVPPLERRDVEAGHVFPGLDQVGLIRVVPVDSSMRYFAQLNRYAYDTSTKTFDFAVALVPVTDAEKKLRTVIANPGDTYTFVEIANQLETEQTVRIKMRNNEGDIVFNEQHVLAPYAQFHFRADQLIAIEENGTIELSVSTPGAIVAYAMSYTKEKDSDNIFAAYESPLRDSYGTTMYGSYNMFLNMLNSIRIGNISDNQTTVRLHFGSGGDIGASSVITLEPHATKVIDLGAAADVSSFDNTNSYGLISVETTSNGAVIPEVIRLGVDQDRYQFGVSTQIR